MTLGSMHGMKFTWAQTWAYVLAWVTLDKSLPFSLGLLSYLKSGLGVGGTNKSFIHLQQPRKILLQLLGH